jgi:hypothetical protein
MAQSPSSRAPDSASLSARAADAGGYVSSVDREGVPQFVWAVGKQPAPRDATPVRAARFHLSRFSAAQKLSQPAIDGAEVVRTADLGDGGVLVHLRQRIDGIEVYPSDVKVLMRRNLELVAISGRLREPSATGRTFQLGAASACARALGITQPQLEAPQDGYQSFAVGASPGRIRPLFFAGEQGIVPAYFIELYAGDDAWRLIASAADGRVLDRRSLVADSSFNYRVWAQTDADKRPLDGPQADFSPHPTGMPDGTQPAFIAPNLVSMEGFNHNPFGAADPWLATGAVQTLGNNVDAYTDNNPPDGYSNGDLRATTTAAGTFDRTYDVTLAPLASNDQSMAAVTQAFYTTNWLHDWWYDSHFDEAAMNAQANNYGRGGLGSDPLHIEVQDSYTAGQRNNANMSTPADGFSPRMQIYVWSGPETHHLTNASSTEFTAGTASFGAQSYNLSADVVLADDGTAPNSDACTPLTNTATGKIVLVDRGSCAFTVKAGNVQTAGGVGMIVANNAAGTTPPGMGGTDTTITIPAMSVTQADGATLKAQIAAGTVTMTMSRQVGTERDGALDNSVVAHEWGHYLHHRLADCGANQCGGMSEGWADFDALMMIARDGDDLTKTFAVGIYSAISFGDSGYFGIRRFPYSVDQTKNALMLHHIHNGETLPTTPKNGGTSANSEVHNTGEVWATQMWEVYVALQQARGTASFESVHRKMSDYIVAGLQLTPRDATFTEQRDAILAAIAARSADDLAVASAAFARRGSGTCAVAPASDSTDNAGVVDDNQLKSVLQIGAVRVDDSIRSCDQDGYLDGDERGRLVIKVANAGPVALDGTTLAITSTTTGITFPDGTTAAIPPLAPYASTEVALTVALDNSVTAPETLQVSIEADNANSCTTAVTRTFAQHINVDDVAAASATEDVESVVPAWSLAGVSNAGVWARTETAPADHAWVGTDVAVATDASLVSPDLIVGTADSFVITFDHRYSFEASTSGTTTTYFDGGVIELSTDGGQTWADISTKVDPGYNGALGNASGNPIGGHQAFVGKNAMWPNRETKTLDLGAMLAGQTVRLRFRIGTDSGSGDYGWEIDNIHVAGITNTPFRALVADQGVCRLICPGGLTACGTSCVHLGTDPLNCGSCANACASGSVCAAGTCAVSCQAGSTNCTGQCIDTQTDNANCGTCGNACPSGTVCGAGQCALSCQQGRTNCSGSCVNLDTDGANCGACGNACAAGTVCSNGSCTLSCSAGATRCGDSCVNLQTDDANCGACGGACSVGSTCQGGKCEAPPVARTSPGSTVYSGEHVMLSAASSTDPNGDPLTFAWTQMTGTHVALAGADQATTGFTAPAVTAPERLTFQVEVANGHASARDHVDVVVLPIPPTPVDQGGCSVAGHGVPSAIWLLAAFAALAFRRRR